MSRRYRTLLQLELMERRKKNRHYSLRSFARDIGIQPSQLSQVLKGRQHLQATTVRRIAKNLFPDKRRQESFFKVFSLETSDADPAAIDRAAAIFDSPAAQQIESEALHSFTNWYDIALLALIQSQNVPPDPDSYGAFLGIDPEDARESLRKLEGIGLIRRTSEGYERTNKAFGTYPNLPSQELHRQFLTKASNVLDHIPSNERLFSYSTALIDKTEFDELKTSAESFISELVDTAQNSNAEDLYLVNLQIFSLKAGRR